MRFTTLCGGLCQTALWRSSQCNKYNSQVPPEQNGNFLPYSLRIVCGFFNVPQLFKGCETGPPAYSPYPRKLESLTIC